MTCEIVEVWKFDCLPEPEGSLAACQWQSYCMSGAFQWANGVWSAHKVCIHRQLTCHGSLPFVLKLTTITKEGFSPTWKWANCWSSLHCAAPQALVWSRGCCEETHQCRCGQMRERGWQGGWNEVSSDVMHMRVFLGNNTTAYEGFSLNDCLKCGNVTN